MQTFLKGNVAARTYVIARRRGGRFGAGESPAAAASFCLEIPGAKIKRCSTAPHETPESVDVKKQLVALEAHQDSGSDEEDLKSDKILKGMIASRNWRRFAQTLRHMDRENEMDEIEVENVQLKEKMRHMEEDIKQVKADNKKLQQQMQEDIRIQNRYKDALQHAQKQLENAQMETDLQRNRVADLKEMLEHMELEMSFAKLDVRPKDEDPKANRPELDAPRVGRVSVEEEADHIFKQLQQQGPFGHGSNQLVSPEFISRSVRLIKKNLLLQRKMSGLLEWRSEATVNKLQLDLSCKAGGKESELRNLVQNLQETLASEHLKFSELQSQHLGHWACFWVQAGRDEKGKEKGHVLVI
eukprot:s1648_g3.t1